ncbi:MAG: hypothetical protein PHY72_01760 [Candidatus Pacebacteria bacterium]|nr:hypothetical protein [Candidatus Paceibacterota bacterium]
MDPVYFAQITKGILGILWSVFKVWWWLPLPFIIFPKLKFIYEWYMNDVYWGKANWMVLEVKIPKEIDRPLKAMEQVISNFWTLYDPPDFKERWFEGKYLLNFSLEIASIDGKIHFYIYLPGAMRKAFESAIYSQYPEVEIEQVMDYTRMVPQDIPNKDWDMWACNFKMMKKRCYPIKTYLSFFEPTQEIEEERRVDPLAVLLEGMSRLRPGEQLWFQVILKPILLDSENDWKVEGREELSKLLKRPLPVKDNKTIVGEAYNLLVHDKEPFKGEEKVEPLLPPELHLSPGEREIVQGIENKMSKHGFETIIRMILLGKKDVFFKPNLRLVLNLSSGVSTINLNGLKPFMTTKVVAPAFYRDKRLYIKKRKLFRRYLSRWAYFFPKTVPGQSHGHLVLNPEEIATLWHFPGKAAMPAAGLETIESKKAGPPANLPIG